MTTPTSPTKPRRRPLDATAITAAATGTVIGVLAATAVISHGLGDSPPVTTVANLATSLPKTADAAEHWLTPAVTSSTLACRADVSSRGATVGVAAVDLPKTADA